VIAVGLIVVVVARSARQKQGQIRNATRLIRGALQGAHADTEGYSSGISIFNPESD